MDEIPRRSSTLSSQDDSLLVQTQVYNSQLFPLGIRYMNRYSTEYDGDDFDYKDTDPDLYCLIKRPVIILEDKL